MLSRLEIGRKERKEFRKRLILAIPLLLWIVFLLGFIYSMLVHHYDFSHTSGACFVFFITLFCVLQSILWLRSE